MNQPTSRILIVWTGKDREVALNMVFMYALHSKSKSWWDEVTLLVWGPSAKLLTDDSELQEKLEGLRKAGIRVVACRECADRYGVSQTLERMGIEVFYTGNMLTDWLKADRPILSI